MSEGNVTNDNLVLIVGKSGVGKSASLMGLEDQGNGLYLNCENNKKLPFKDDFLKAVITDPYTIYEAFNRANEMPEVHTVIVDTVSFLMDMFESVHVIPATDTQKMWGMYAQYFKNLMAQYVAKTDKNVIMLSHVADILNEANGVMETRVKVKGALMNTGIEAYFSTVVAAKTKTLKELEGYKNDLLNITGEDEMLGYKHVFQTRKTKATIGEAIRGPMGMWEVEETFIDNDAQFLLNRLHEYYA